MTLSSLKILEAAATEEAKMICEECDKPLEFGIDGVCACGKELCYECFVKRHKSVCDKRAALSRLEGEGGEG